jgi:hypothetical protein
MVATYSSLLLAAVRNPSPGSYTKPGVTRERRQILLHTVTEAIRNLIGCFGNTKRQGFSIRRNKYEEYLSGWKTVTHELLTGGAYLHAISEKYTTKYFRGMSIEEVHHRKPMTPLLAMFRNCHIFAGRRAHRRTMHRALSWWIETLHEVGIDLMYYGLKEKAVWTKMDVARECICFLGEPSKSTYIDGLPWFWKRLVGFRYGPSPKDWVFWGNEPWTNLPETFG